ncbi:hypothetical protein QBC46DRAFT_269584 [Diplogelasinospora grovesii]|uniref:Uncharacterized protein n=1 Tax=Diplogelasinospora grovesii TaxID=303347 RepID=A0AAN6N272_9PEZI|nr:hypothetical protein QBC46DRAFT_269584 [Diplogelasinospora grovesii]
MGWRFHQSDDIREPTEGPRELSLLQLGSVDEIAKTSLLMGCNMATANYFRPVEKKHSHLFPVPFELLGMLSKTLHIRNTCFRTLPNPTPYSWDRTVFSTRRLTMAYGRLITDDDIMEPTTTQIEAIADLGSKVEIASSEDARTNVPGYSMGLLHTLHDALDQCDAYLKEKSEDLVLTVLCKHLQTVLTMINDLKDPDNDPVKTLYAAIPKWCRARRFDELSGTDPENTGAMLMNIYFCVVLHQVTHHVATSFSQTRSTRSEPSRNKGKPGMAAAVGPTSPQLPPASLPFFNTEAVETQAAHIWCTLILRMLCWLTLHDFHPPDDVQISKSGLLGSPMLVYIT